MFIQTRDLPRENISWLWIYFRTTNLSKLHGGLKRRNRVLGCVGSMSSCVFPLFNSSELVWSLKFVEIIRGKCIPKVYLSYISVAYQLGLVAMNSRSSLMELWWCRTNHDIDLPILWVRTWWRACRWGCWSSSWCIAWYQLQILHWGSSTYG